MRVNAVAEGVAIPFDDKDVVTTSEVLVHLLEAYRVAQMLVRFKGRYHSVQSYRAMAQLLGTQSRWTRTACITFRMKHGSTCRNY